jgi:hypothetical protein
MKKIFLVFLAVFFLFEIEFLYCNEKVDNLFHMAFLKFLQENANEKVLYSRFIYSGKERAKPFTLIFIYKLSEPKGVVAFVGADNITNMFYVNYSNKYNELVSYDVHGGLWEIEEAREILNLVTQTCLKIIKCNEIVLGLE